MDCQLSTGRDVVHSDHCDYPEDLAEQCKYIMWSTLLKMTSGFFLDRFIDSNHTIIYRQFVWLSVKEEPHWQGASMSEKGKLGIII